MSNEMPSHGSDADADADADALAVAFSHGGTAETIFDLKILGDFCTTRPPRPRGVVQEEYDRQFSMGANFTFIQCGEDVILPPMDWLGEGEDDTGIFEIFRPRESDNNPYVRLKVGRITRGEEAFELHVFYRHLKVSTDYVGLVSIMVNLDVVSFDIQTGLMAGGANGSNVVAAAAVAVHHQRTPPHPMQGTRGLV